MKLILASRSPRREELLALFGIAFDSVAADVDESPLPGEQPDALTTRLAITKAEHVYRQLGAGHVVLGGDTTVAIHDRMLGKPGDRAEAIAMLSLLSGTKHEVLSSVAITDSLGTRAKLSRTTVHFGAMTAAQIERYCDSGEPFDKAGGYGIQGVAGAFIERIFGSHSGVVGLPLRETRLLLESAGLLAAG